jgi:hypothetical protein
VGKSFSPNLRLYNEAGVDEQEEEEEEEERPKKQPRATKKVLPKGIQSWIRYKQVIRQKHPFDSKARAARACARSKSQTGSMYNSGNI